MQHLFAQLFTNSQLVQDLSLGRIVCNIALSKFVLIVVVLKINSLSSALALVSNFDLRILIYFKGAIRKSHRPINTLVDC